MGALPAPQHSNSCVDLGLRTRQKLTMTKTAPERVDHDVNFMIDAVKTG
jgi:hypothetical protein